MREINKPYTLPSGDIIMCINNTEPNPIVGTNGASSQSEFQLISFANGQFPTDPCYIVIQNGGSKESEMFSIQEAIKKYPYERK